MGLTETQYQASVAARRSFRIVQCPAAAFKKMKSLADTGWDGDYVVPNQLSSRALNGPLILLNNWYGWEALEGLTPVVRTDLSKLGYLRGIPTNRWLDRALEIVGLSRCEIYITQACVLLPRKPTGTTISDEVYEASFRHVLRHEIGGRTAVALGNPAQKACKINGIPFVGAKHPSYQGGEGRAQEIAAAIQKVL